MRNPLGFIEAIRCQEDTMDPAIDTGHPETNIDAYRKTQDSKHLRFKDGMQPVVFKLARIKAAYLLDTLANITSLEEKFMAAFLASCHEISQGTKSKRPSRMLTKAHTTKVADDEWLDMVRDAFGAFAIMEMGGIALNDAYVSDEAAAGFF